jgi:hypothetical protein
MNITERENALKEIRKYATTGGCRNTTIVNLHRLLLLDCNEYKQTPEYGFMHEVDNKVPDLFLRSQYRKELEKKEGINIPNEFL